MKMIFVIKWFYKGLITFHLIYNYLKPALFPVSMLNNTGTRHMFFPYIKLYQQQEKNALAFTPRSTTPQR